MRAIKRITAAFLSLALLGTGLLSASAESETETYDDWLDFDINSGFVSGLPIGITANQLNLQFKNTVGELLSNYDPVSTGAKTEKDGSEYVLIVLGDVSGDGQVNGTDFMQVRRQYLGNFEMDAVQEKAADTNRDGNINSTDFMQIRKHFLGTFKITSVSFSQLLKNNEYAAVSQELIETICKDYYSLETHMLQNDLQATWGTTLWPFGSFLEALTETYKLYPENETIRTYLLDALDYGLNNFKVEGALSTPVGDFENIVYYNASAFNHGDYYYDDNAWIALQFLNAYEIFGDQKYLTKAEEILAFFETGIDDALGGGLYWDKRFNCKNTCADGPAAIGYLWAYKLTGNEHYLERGKELVDWLNATLRDTDGLYWDNMATDGGLNSWKAFYNQGTPLYAMCLLYEITGDEKYKALADETAQSALAYSFRTVWDNGLTYILNGNPIYKSWCVGWLYRGFEQYVTMTGDCTEFYDKMHQILDKNLATKDEYGYYDPYFCTGHYPDENPHEVLQTSGVTSVYALQAYYEIYIEPTL